MSLPFTLPPVVPSENDRLHPGQSLQPGQYIDSANGSIASSTSKTATSSSTAARTHYGPPPAMVPLAIASCRRTAIW